MAQVNVRIDDTIKKEAEQILDSIGLNTSTAITIFFKAIIRENRMPFDLVADPFYSSDNIRYLEHKAAEYKAGKLKLETHDLIEE